MAPPLSVRRLVSAAIPLSLALLAASGCATHRPTDELAQAVQTGERPVSMKGEEMFFDRRLQVTVTVARGIGRGEGGGGRHGGGHGGGSAHMPTTSDLAGMDNDEAMAYLRAKSEVGSPMPPVTIHLKIENLSGKVYTVDIDDFDSDLGNFAVHPEELAVAPTQVAEPDPMISQMGVTADVIPFKVTLKMEGLTETRTIQVRNVMAPAAAP